MFTRLVLSAAAPLLAFSACAAWSPPPAPGEAPLQQPGTSVRASGEQNPLTGLVSLAVQRIDTADEVAAAKFGTSQPIDDPAREHQELDEVTAAALKLGVDPGETARFFQDQIEANKVVQRGLYGLWSEHPERRPSTKPDLTTTVRPQLDQLTTQIMDQLRATVEVRHSGATCVDQARQAVAGADRNLDELHRHALDVAMGSVCTRTG
jgi:chorismate mutase